MIEAARRIDDVSSYYDGKTKSVLDRYGPGPMVHYHTGLINKPVAMEYITAARILRRLLVVAQQDMMLRAAEAWNVHGSVLDVGCGLGGGSIFWALNPFVDRVTAITIAPSHIPIVNDFCAKAGVGYKVQAIHADAHEFSSVEKFDTMVAVDSSGYLDRHRWFARANELLRPEGRVHVIDCFLEQSPYQKPFDSYWHTQIGSIDEYQKAAGAAGLRLYSVLDVTHQASNFWSTTMALIKTEMEVSQNRQKEESLRAHELVHKGLSGGGLSYKIATWYKPD